MALHAVLKHWHPMIGKDWHVPWTPGLPPPPPGTPPVPYITFSPMMGLGFQCHMAPDVLSHYYGQTMLKGTNIGAMIPHFGPPSNLLIIEVPLSSSKSYFGSSRYVSKGTPVAVALYWVMNLNLNCGTPIPTPTGTVVALTTHFVEMSIGDVLAGMIEMAVAIAIAAVLHKISVKSKVGERIGDHVKEQLTKRYFFRAWNEALDYGLGENTAKFLQEEMAKEAHKYVFKWVDHVAEKGLDKFADTIIELVTGKVIPADKGGDKAKEPHEKSEEEEEPPEGFSKLADHSGAALDKYFNDSPPNGPVDIGHGENE